MLEALGQAGCSCWLEGGWGIDALAGRQTRLHRDADIDFDAEREAEVLAVLYNLGYRETLDERPTRFELVSSDGSCVDLHPIRLQASGDAVQIAHDGIVWHFRAAWFTTGAILGQRVPCYTVDGQRYFHSGYELRDVDVEDLRVLDQLDRSE